MNNVIAKIKNLFLNRNTVTILGVIAGVIALWFFYSATLSKAVDPVLVPVAAVDLPAGTLITKEQIEYVEVNNDVLKKGSIITRFDQLNGYYVANGTSVTKGAMFYKDQVIEKDKLIKRDTEIIPEGYTIYPLKVDNTTTYANSIYPGDKIDLWIKIDTGSNTFIYKEFITSIEVLSVRDSRQFDVFDVTTGQRTPAYIRFAVPEELYIYLSNVELLDRMTLYPVPRNSSYTDQNAEPKIADEQLISYIDALVYQLSEGTTNINTGINDNNEVTE